jgi:hypothetical protein
VGKSGTYDNERRDYNNKEGSSNNNNNNGKFPNALDHSYTYANSNNNNNKYNDYAVNKSFDSFSNMRREH